MLKIAPVVIARRRTVPIILNTSPTTSPTVRPPTTAVVLATFPTFFALFLSNANVFYLSYITMLSFIKETDVIACKKFPLFEQLRLLYHNLHKTCKCMVKGILGQTIVSRLEYDKETCAL